MKEGEKEKFLWEVLMRKWKAHKKNSKIENQ